MDPPFNRPRPPPPCTALQELLRGGATVVVATSQPSRFPYVQSLYELQAGRLQKRS